MFRSLKMLASVLVCVFVLSACNPSQTQKVAMVNIESILQSEPHAKEAIIQINKAKEIYQYNLTTIEKKLATYKNKEQGKAYLTEIAKQLQVQLNNSKILVNQALTNTLVKVLNENAKDYDLIINTSGIIYVKPAEEGKEGEKGKKSKMPQDITNKIQNLYNKETVNYPNLPTRIENPNLPADMGTSDKKSK